MTGIPDPDRYRTDTAVPYLNPAAVQAVPFADVADAVVAALADGLDPAADPDRAVLPVAAGQLLLMPSQTAGHVGVKIVGVAPDNPARGLPRIQGSYLLLDGPTLRPVAIIDGAALTTLRTPALSLAATRLLAPERTRRLVIFGAGPQAAGHLRALHGVLTPDSVTVLSRSVERAAALAGAARRDLGVAARAATAGGIVAEIAAADVIVCATTAVRPLFTADAVRPGALVIAVGSHEPDVLELPPPLLAGAQVVVEDPATAAREAGEVVTAIREGLLDPSALVGLADLVAGRAAADPDRTRVFKSVGMGWEDLVVATRVFAHYTRGVDGDG